MRGKEVIPLLREDLKRERFGGARKLSSMNRKARAKNELIETSKTIGKGLNAIRDQGYKGKVLSTTYWGETSTSEHFGPEYLSKLRNYWLSSGTKENFYTWIQNPVNRQKALEMFEGDPRYESPETYFDGGVEYHKTDESKLCVKYLQEEERAAYVKSVQDGCLFSSDGLVFDTKDHVSDQVKGKAIFVIGPDKTLYAGSHIANQFHHTSFLSGGAVIGAGEIETDANGTLVCLSNRTGHFLSDGQTMLDTLSILREKGVDLSQAQLQILNTPDKPTLFYNAEEFVASKGQCLPQRVIQGDMQNLGELLAGLQEARDKGGEDISKVRVQIIHPETLERVEMNGAEAVEKFAAS